MNEIWKDIPGYEGLYKITKNGLVYSYNKKSIKTSYISIKYNYQTLYKDGKKRNYRVSQLIAMAFLNHKPDRFKLVVDHINNDSFDDRLENLQVITNRLNASKDRKNKSSQYTGVYLCKQTGKWRSDIQYQKKNIYIGRFDSELEAQNAYINKLKELEHNQ